MGILLRFVPAHTLRLTTSRILLTHVANFTRLAEVGKLEVPKTTGKYDTGQLILHKVFGYRGVILFPWLARVYDRDATNKKESSETSASEASGDSLSNVGKEVKGRTHTFYQVLIDTRDAPYIRHDKVTTLKPDEKHNAVLILWRLSRHVAALDGRQNHSGLMLLDIHWLNLARDSPEQATMRAQTEAVTFLGNQESSRSLYAIPGLDYVAHDDIIPYTSVERVPLQHELFDKFLMHNPDKDPPFIAQETLRAWQKKNHPWLELSDVHRETTEGVRVTVIPFYMGSRESQNSAVYWWRYCIRLENLGGQAVQLRERHWRIFSLSGTLETVRGRGVVGQEPVLARHAPAFQYSSHVSLQAPSGHMWGTFRMEREDGYTFDCRIPPFSLESKPDEGAPVAPTPA